jgi:hypothetical protein
MRFMIADDNNPAVSVHPLAHHQPGISTPLRGTERIYGAMQAHFLSR